MDRLGGFHSFQTKPDWRNLNRGVSLQYIPKKELNEISWTFNIVISIRGDHCRWSTGKGQITQLLCSCWRESKAIDDISFSGLSQLWMITEYLTTRKLWSTNPCNLRWSRSIQFEANNWSYSWNFCRIPVPLLFWWWFHLFSNPVWDDNPSLVVQWCFPHQLYTNFYLQ